jgi:hypothetical protein
VSRLFKGHYCHTDGRTNLGPSDELQVLRQKASKEGAEVYKMGSQVDVCDIVRTLGLAVEHETAQMTFNYFEMHILCWRLLR